MTFIGTIQYAGESKGDRRRLVVQLRQSVTRRRGDVVDLTTGKYLTHKDVPGYRDEFFFVYLTTPKGQLIGSLCERYGVHQIPVRLTATYGPYGWEITDIDTAREGSPEPENAA